MEHLKIMAALDIISQCDCLSITELDKKLIINVFGKIIKSFKEVGINNTEMNAMYEVLKISTWNDGYFCCMARKLCNLLHQKVGFYANIKSAIENTVL